MAGCCKGDAIHENHTKQHEVTRRVNDLIRVISCPFVDRLKVLDRCSSFFASLLVSALKRERQVVDEPQASGIDVGLLQAGRVFP